MYPSKGIIKVNTELPDALFDRPEVIEKTFHFCHCNHNDSVRSSLQRFCFELVKKSKWILLGEFFASPLWLAVVLANVLKGYFVCVPDASCRTCAAPVLGELCLRNGVSFVVHMRVGRRDSACWGLADFVSVCSKVGEGWGLLPGGCYWAAAVSIVMDVVSLSKFRGGHMLSCWVAEYWVLDDFVSVRGRILNQPTCSNNWMNLRLWILLPILTTENWLWY